MMLLLSFAVSNHGAARDRIELELVRPAFTRLRPPEGEEWRAHVFPVAGVFGANASGKSTLLDAIEFVRKAVRGWSFVQRPFRLDPAAAKEPSRYELDFVTGGRRYRYVLEVTGEQVRTERLEEVGDSPQGRWRRLFERDVERDGTGVRLARGLGSIGKVGEREPVLSRALTLHHPGLAPIAQALANGVRALPLGGMDRDERIASIVSGLAEGGIGFQDVLAILKIADIGIDGVDLRVEDLPEALRETGEQLLEAFQSVVASITGADSQQKPRELERFVRMLEFSHRGPGDAHGTLGLSEQSDGTLSWLALAVPAVEVLREGGVLCIDELGSSLHPRLSSLLVEAFNDPATNPRGAQLLFTSHDVTLLSPLSGLELEAEQIWFTEKERDGVMQLYSLADFPHPRDANIARRYLGGRYGAVPRTAMSLLPPLLDAEDASASHTAEAGDPRVEQSRAS